MAVLAELIHDGGMGSLACLLSAVAFGVMAIFAKLAYAQGVTVDTLLLVRFGIAGVVLLALSHLRGRLRGAGRATVVAGLLMGGLGYAAQSGLYFGALTRIDASLVALLFCTYPLMVMALAVLTRRDRPSLRRAVSLLLALLGVTLVLGGAATGHLDPLGAAFAVGAAVVYTVYILIGDRVAATDPLVSSAFVCCGAFTSFALWTLTHGGPHFSFHPSAWLWLVLIALISTVAAIALFFTGLAVVGPSVASLLSIVEPVVTVGCAAWVFGEHLSAGQILGGVVVLAAVALVQWPVRATPTPDQVAPPA